MPSAVDVRHFRCVASSDVGVPSTLNTVLSAVSNRHSAGMLSAVDIRQCRCVNSGDLGVLSTLDSAGVPSAVV